MRVCDRCYLDGKVSEAVISVNFDGVEVEETQDVCDECYQAVRELLITPPPRRRKRGVLSLTGKGDD